MVLVDLAIIHGKHLVNESAARPVAQTAEAGFALDPAVQANLHQVVDSHPNATAITLTTVMAQPTILVKQSQGLSAFAAQTGNALAAVNEQQARLFAQKYYAGTASVRTATLLTQNPPSELGGRALPIWRVDFDDAWGTTLYLSPVTGELLTQRHTLWRVFDFLWMLHIMDYAERENVNNTILRVVAAMAFMLVLTGFWYLYFRLNVSTAVRAWWHGVKA